MWEVGKVGFPSFPKRGKKSVASRYNYLSTQYNSRYTSIRYMSGFQMSGRIYLYIQVYEFYKGLYHHILVYTLIYKPEYAMMIITGIQVLIHHQWCQYGDS